VIGVSIVPLSKVLTIYANVFFESELLIILTLDLKSNFDKKELINDVCSLIVKQNQSTLLGASTAYWTAGFKVQILDDDKIPIKQIKL